MVLVLKHTVFISEYKILEFSVIIHILTLRGICLPGIFWLIMCWKFIAVNEVLHVRKGGTTYLLESLTWLAEKTTELISGYEPLNLGIGSFLNSDNLDALDLGF